MLYSGTEKTRSRPQKHWREYCQDRATRETPKRTLTRKAYQGNSGRMLTKETLKRTLTRKADERNYEVNVDKRRWQEKHWRERWQKKPRRSNIHLWKDRQVSGRQKETWPFTHWVKCDVWRRRKDVCWKLSRLHMSIVGAQSSNQRILSLHVQSRSTINECCLNLFIIWAQSNSHRMPTPQWHLAAMYLRWSMANKGEMEGADRLGQHVFLLSFNTGNIFSFFLCGKYLLRSEREMQQTKGPTRVVKALAMPLRTLDVFYFCCALRQTVIHATLCGIMPLLLCHF